MMRWLIAAIVLSVASAALWTPDVLAGGEKEADYIKVKAKGKLVTGIVAIGGETTGTVVQTKYGVLELEIKDKKLRALVEKLNKKDVYIEGRLRIDNKGIEVPLRIIVTVTVLKAAK